MKLAALVPDVASSVCISKKKIKLAKTKHLSSGISAAI